MFRLPDIWNYARSLDLPFFRKEEEEEIPPKESSILNIGTGDTGKDVQIDNHLVLKVYNIAPQTHLVLSDNEDIPADVRATRVDSTGMGKRKSRGEAIIDANRSKLTSDFQQYSETFGSNVGAESGGTGSNSPIVADVNKSCGRSTENILSMREDEHPRNELENLVKTVEDFKAVREKWGGGVMAIIKPEPSYSSARTNIANYCFVQNLACAQGTTNPSDLCARVDDHGFAVLLSVKVLTKYKTNPSHLYEILKNRVKTLIKKGYLAEDSTDLYPSMFGPTDILEEKETLSGLIRRAFVDAGINVNDRVFEPVIAYNHFLNNRILWVHAIVPIDVDACLKRILNSHVIRSEEK